MMYKDNEIEGIETKPLLIIMGVLFVMPALIMTQIEFPEGNAGIVACLVYFIWTILLIGLGAKHSKALKK